MKYMTVQSLDITMFGSIGRDTVKSNHVIKEQFHIFFTAK